MRHCLRYYGALITLPLASRFARSPAADTIPLPAVLATTAGTTTKAGNPWSASTVRLALERLGLA